MRLLRSTLRVAVLPALLLSACSIEDLTGGADRYDPTDLTYRLMPSGDPVAPSGILLEWTPPTSSRVATFDVHARNSTSQSWTLRATTTSPSFHDAGLPQLQYYVTAHDDEGRELGRSYSITVDERNRLPAPAELRSITLNRSVQLAWAGNAAGADPNAFDYYRVYSAPWSASGNRCDAGRWVLEGSTSSDGFLVNGLANGATRCFAVSAVRRDGHESIWSPVRVDTPRPDARFVLVDAFESRPSTSAFLFHDAANARYGVLVHGDAAQADFRVERRADGSLWMRTVRPETRVAVFGDRPIPELTTVDRAPDVSFVSGAVELLPGWGYVFSVRQSDGVHYAAVRVGYVAREHVVIDWAYQPAAGNPELLRGDDD